MSSSGLPAFSFENRMSRFSTAVIGALCKEIHGVVGDRAEAFGSVQLPDWSRGLTSL